MATKITQRKKPHYVLIIEDNTHHAELITEVLDRHFAPVIIHTVDTTEDGIDFLQQSAYDLVVAGGIVGGNPITSFIKDLVRLAGKAPFIVISGRGDERLAADIIKRGATEYLTKTQETLEHLASIFERHMRTTRGGRRHKAGTPKGTQTAKAPSPSELIQEVDRLTQQALAIAGPRRRKGGGAPSDIDQLDRLLSQIQRLRDLAAKMKIKE